jgi:molybdopterin synthase sulfur carrier subunit
MITVLLFAGLKETIGNSELQLDGTPLLVNDLIVNLQEIYPTAPLHNVLVAINEEFVSREQQIVNGDIVALLPPVSGG